MRSARKFIDDGDKLKVTLRFRGSEQVPLGAAAPRKLDVDRDTVRSEIAPRQEEKGRGCRTG